MSIALISSLYRFQKHLPTYTAAVYGFARRVSGAGIAVHYLPIVNDASPHERASIDRLAREINAGYFGRMTPVYVERESLYASWNRGIARAQTDYFGSWNADDLRSAPAFIEGYRALRAGATLVDFAFTRVSRARRLGLFAREERRAVPLLFHPERFTRRNGLGPFFLASRALYQRVGSFDENFLVAGDMEWAARAQPHARFHAASSDGGDFLIHGDNLSNIGGDREAIEVNIIFMRRGQWDQLRPADPNALRQAWDGWGRPAGQSLPAEVQAYLWGPGSQQRWQQYQRERRAGALQRKIRLALAARGLVPSAEWSAYQRSQSARGDEG